MANAVRTRKEILDFLKGQGTDEGLLTPEELQARLEAYQEIQGLGPENILNQETLLNELKSAAGAGREGLANAIGQQLIRKPDSTNLEIMAAISPNDAGQTSIIEIGRIADDFKRRIKQGDFYQTNYTSYPEDIKRIQNLIETGQFKREQEAGLDEFLNTLPSELARGRDEFFGTQYDIASGEFGRNIAPRIRASLNMRGLLDSGDLASELTRSASGIQSGLEQSEFEQQQEDDLFFQNAAYQTTLRREIESGNDISQATEFARGEQRQNQEFGFQRTQAKLKMQLDEELFKREQERSLLAQRERQRLESERASEESRNALISGIGSSVGQIGGTVIGAKLASKAAVKGVTT